MNSPGTPPRATVPRTKHNQIDLPLMNEADYVVRRRSVADNGFRIAMYAHFVRHQLDQAGDRILRLTAGKTFRRQREFPFPLTIRGRAPAPAAAAIEAA